LASLGCSGVSYCAVVVNSVYTLVVVENEALDGGADGWIIHISKNFNE
jgi:hypothetical protein